MINYGLYALLQMVLTNSWHMVVNKMNSGHNSMNLKPAVKVIDEHKVWFMHTEFVEKEDNFCLQVIIIVANIEYRNIVYICVGTGLQKDIQIILLMYGQ